VFIELVELLRCIREHDESWLVASIEELSDRSISRGRLGCPICHAEYPVVEGVADFSGATVSPAVPSHSADPEDVGLRAGAFLGLAENSGTVVLGGSWAAGAVPLQRSTDARVFVANAPIDAHDISIGRILVDKTLPFGVASCAGVALDDSFHYQVFESATRVIRAGGRMVGPASVPRPAGFALLAEDAEWWVAEKPAEVTTLRRGNR
jgi:hypothetical protein